MKAANRYLLLFMIITAIQVAVIVAWGNRKDNLYWDEFFTLERAHYYSSNNGEDHFIDQDPDYNIGEWMPVSFVKDTIIVSEAETLLAEPFIDVVKKLFKTHNYSAYLNIAESILSMGEFSIWPAIILNLIFFLLNQLVLYAMCRRVAENATFPLAVCAMYGFGSMCISMALFIRFYMYSTLLVSLFTYLHILYYDADADRLTIRLKRVLLIFISFLALYVAHKNAQYTVIYGGIYVIAFAVVLFAQKGIRRFLYYAAPVFVGGFTYLYTQTEYLDVLFDMKNAYQEADSAMSSTLEGILEFKLVYLPNRIVDMAHIFGKYIFGSFFAMIFFLLIAVVMAIVYKLRRTDMDKRDTYSAVIISSSVAALAYIVLFTTFGLYEQVRYISFVFPELVMVVMMVVYNTFRTDALRYSFASLVIITMVLSVNVKGKIDMLYTGDMESIERVREFGADSYLIGEGTHRTFITYETAYVAEDGAEFYVYDELQEGAKDNLKNNLRDKMVLVGAYGVSTQDIQDMLKEEGFEVNWIADTYHNVFFTAVRN